MNCQICGALEHEPCEKCGTIVHIGMFPFCPHPPIHGSAMFTALDKPFENYYDEGLGVEITGQDHRRRVMRDLKVDHRDPPSKGEMSARRDRVEQQRRSARG